MFLLDGQPIPPDMAFEHEGVVYPPNWIMLASPEEREAIGITEVVEEPRPDDFYAMVSADPNNPGQWIVTPFTPEEMKPRLENYSRQKREQRANAGVEYNDGTATTLIPTDQNTRDQFFNYRIIQDRPDAPPVTAYDTGLKVVALSSAQLLTVEQQMEDRIQGCYLTQLDLQTQIDGGTVTLKEEIDAAYAAVP